MDKFGDKCQPTALSVLAGAKAAAGTVRERIITVSRGEEALQDLHDLPLNRYPYDILMPRVWELRAVLTAYDAVYVAIAELLDAPLVTCDRNIALASGHRAAVEDI